MRLWMSGMWAACLREIKGIPSRPQEWISSALLPIFWLLIIVGIFGQGLMTSVPVGVVNEDGGSLSRQVLMKLEALPSVRPVPFDSRHEAEASLKAARTYGTIVFPKHFTRDSLKGEGTLEFVLNKSYYAVATTLEVDVKTALANLAKEVGAAKMTAARGGTFEANAERLRIQYPEVYFLGNPGFNFSAYLLPTLIPGLIALAAALTFGGLLIREWRDGGTNELLRTANGYASAAMVGKLLPWFGFYCLVGLGWVAGFAGWMGWAPAGSYWLWCAATILFILSVLSIAILFCGLAVSWILGLSALIAYFAPCFPFTGFSYPLEAMTPGVAWFGELLPLTHYLAIQGQIWMLGSPVDHTLKTMGILSLFVVIPLAIGVPVYLWRFRLGARREALREAHDAREQALSGDVP